jgi:hypothetical protein
VSDTGSGFAAEWTHVAITVSTSGSTINTTIYYNANITGVTPSPSATAITNLTATIIGKGITPTANDQHLDALINDVKIFDSALTATQVSTQYDSEKCNIYFQIFII